MRMIKSIVLIMHKENVSPSLFGLIGRTALGSLSTIEVKSQHSRETLTAR
jgi:hypothetical protein